MWQKLAPKLLLISAWLLASIHCALAGDPIGVNRELQSVQSNWPDAQFSVDVTGLSDNAAVVDRSLQIEYEAAHPGYVTYLRESSHGDLVLSHDTSSAPNSSGVLTFPIHPPLGVERTLLLFCDRPLDNSLFEAPTEAAAGHIAQALSVVNRIKALQANGLHMAVRRLSYMVEAPPGQTQYTTRSVIRIVEAAGDRNEAGGDLTKRFPTRIEFDFNSDQLTEQSKRDLDIFGAALVSRLHDRKVMLEGRTDAIGTDDYNRDLSSRRARAAQQYLMESFGLSPSQIDAAGLGKAGEPNDSEEERRRNRRVDFVFAGGRKTTN